MSVFYVKLNEQGYVQEYDWANSKSLEWKRTKYDGDYEVTVQIYFSKFVDGELVLDEEAYQAYLNEQSKPQPEPKSSQLDRMEQEIQNIKTSIEEQNTYKQAYNELTDNSEIQPAVMRANIQMLMMAPSHTAIINAEPFIDEYVNATSESPISYKQGDIRKYLGQVYECIKEYTHNGEPNWEPDKEKTLWKIMHTKDKTNPKPFVQPTGAHDIYMKDEVCLFEIDGVMKLCTSKVDNNAYSPSDYAQNWTIEDYQA